MGNSREHIQVITPDNKLFAKLIIPTMSGGKSISQVEMGNISGGSVTNESQIDYVNNLIIHRDHIEIGVILFDNFNWNITGRMNVKTESSPNRTIRVGMENVTEIKREMIKHHPGLIFETDDHVFNFKFAESISKFQSTSNFDETIINEAYYMIKNQMGGGNFKQGIESGEDNPKDSSLTDELERLKQLHDEGDLNESEYEKAKNKLLE
ncbi:SHOCT domain-containing protein [Halobaculum roseum]|uniref:SHOCT domain-containing protein n=1 Tax=Halobaculum roseum TaxID=2175149 RepID=A0ABD5MQ16_9EURY|nr:SHOCT domain-containing protein [Halobaculum roseum]QZY03363.1 SHOCT domain-containing protein [Halobaculum roseum]